MKFTLKDILNDIVVSPGNSPDDTANEKPDVTSSHAQQKKLQIVLVSEFEKKKALLLDRLLEEPVLRADIAGKKPVITRISCGFHTTESCEECVELVNISNLSALDSGTRKSLLNTTDVVLGIVSAHSPISIAESNFIKEAVLHINVGYIIFIVADIYEEQSRKEVLYHIQNKIFEYIENATEKDDESKSKYFGGWISTIYNVPRDKESFENVAVIVFERENLRHLENKTHIENSSCVLQTEPVPEKYPFTQWEVYGSPAYGIVKNNPEVIFVSEKTGRRKIIINDKRLIVDFPGVEDEENIESMLGEGSLYPWVSFGADFETHGDDEYMMIWTVQPDGRFWEDETGFGGTSDNEIKLYALINSEGEFMGPFRLYKFGTHWYK